jgi:hypothetical protein
MPQTAVGTHLDMPLDIHRDFLAEVSFDSALFFEDLADVVDLLFAEIAHLLVKIDSRSMQ